MLTASVLASLLLLADAPLYVGEVDLPHGVYGPGGESIPAGKRSVEVRVNDGKYTLTFAGPEKQRVSLTGAPFTGLDSFVISVAGTILLWPYKEPPAEESRSKLSPYLTNVDWRT